MAERSGDDETVDMGALGQEGDVCSSCGVALAVDQRYCLNCGQARAEPRLDFTKHIGPGAAEAEAPIVSSGPRGSGGGGPQWNPIAAVGAIAVLGVMLLLGVLIGKDDNGETVAAAPVTTTTAAPVAAAPAAGAADAGAAKKGGGGDDAAKAAKASGGGVQGGSGSTEGISTENPLEGLTGEELQEAQKNAPDVVATDGEQAALDPGPAGGGEGGGACIGC
jgi:hypothetical protein